MSTLKRHSFTKAQHLLDLFPVLVILGVRQCGKTTLAKELRPQWKYFDLENGQDFEFITRDFDFFFQEHPNAIIIDEAQESPQLFKEIRGIIDKNRTEKNRFILTGSSSPELLKSVADSLAGRAAILHLGTLKMTEFYQKPLSNFYELFQHKLSKESITNLQQLNTLLTTKEVQEAHLKGGYPEPALEKNALFYEQWMDNYFRTYINRDVRKLFPKLDSIRFRRFIYLISQSNGHLINKSEIGRAIETSEITVRDYLEIAHGTFIWRNIYSYENTKKALVKKPKGIFRDSGLSHFLNKIYTQDDLQRYGHIGLDFEAFVIEELLKGLESMLISNWHPFYYRTRNGSEVDLILEGPFGLLPIEIKYGLKTQLKDLRALNEFIKDYDVPLGIVINHSTEVKKLSDRIIQIPVGLI